MIHKHNTLLLIVLFVSIAQNLAAQGPVFTVDFNNGTATPAIGDASVEGPFYLTEDRFGNSEAAANFLPLHYDDLRVYEGSQSLKLEPPVSFSVWVKYDGQPDANSYFLTSTDSARFHGGINLHLGEDLRPRLQLCDGRSGGEFSRLSFIADLQVKRNEWTHIAYVVDSSRQVSIFVDGLESSYTLDGFNDARIIRYFDMPMRIGKKWDLFYIGGLDDIAIYDRVLTAEEVELLANDEDVTSTQDVLNDTQFSITPTIGSENIKLEYHTDGNSRVLLVEAMALDGRRFALPAHRSGKYDVSTLPAGAYLISTRFSNGKMASAKFVKL